MIRSLLGDKDTTTTAKYAHLLEHPITATADATAGHLAESPECEAKADAGTNALNFPSVRELGVGAHLRNHELIPPYAKPTSTVTFMML